jgi:hypothetical protein
MADDYAADVVLDIGCGGIEGNDVVIDHAERHAITANGGLVYEPALNGDGYEQWLYIDTAAGKTLEITGDLGDFVISAVAVLATIELRVYLTSTTGYCGLVGRDQGEGYQWSFGVEDGYPVFFMNNWQDDGPYYKFTGTVTVPTGQLVTLSVSKFYDFTLPVTFAVDGVVDVGTYTISPAYANYEAHVGGPLLVGFTEFDSSDDCPPFYLDGLRWTTASRFDESGDYTPFWPVCGDPPPEGPYSDFWTDFTRTRELPP